MWRLLMNLHVSSGLFMKLINVVDVDASEVHCISVFMLPSCGLSVLIHRFIDQTKAPHLTELT